MALGEAMLGAAGVLGLGVAFGLLALAPASRPTRIFAFYLALEGMRRILQWAVDAFWPAWSAPGDVAALYVIVPGPFLLLLFTLGYPVARGPVGRHPWTGPVVVGTALALDVLFFLDHGAWFGTGGWALWPGAGPLSLLGAFFPAFAEMVVLLFVRDVVRGRHPAHARSLLLLAMVLAITPSFTATRNLAGAALGIQALTLPGYASFLAAVVPHVAALALVAGALRGGAPGPLQRTLRVTLAVLVLGPLGGVVAAGLVFLDPSLGPAMGVIPSGVFALASPLLMAYALLRHRLFDLDLRVKQTIRESTVLGAFAVVVLLTREGAQVVLPGEGATLVGLAAAGGLVLALGRVRRLGQRLADRALPGVSEDPAYLNARKLEVYRAALEEGLSAGGDVPGPATPRLAALRAELGLTGRDHEVLAFAVRAARMPWRPRPLEPGALLLGRYRVDRLLGQGANGATYLARNEAEGGAPVAVKALRPERGGDAEGLREARAMQSVRHPHVVAMHEVADAAGQAVIVMEYVPGGSLADRLARGPLDPAGWRRVARGLLQALGAVHGAGAVHRDVKPSNVLLTAEGEAKLADFGIAQVAGFETTAGGPGGDLTSAVGTVRFMSPEHARGRRVTERSDLFSAAATLYEAWTGQPYLAPLPGESAVELQMRAAGGQAFPARFEGPPALRRWFAKALDPRPERRFGGAAEMLAALERAAPAAGPGRPARGAGSLRGEAQPRPTHAEDVAGA